MCKLKNKTSEWYELWIKKYRKINKNGIKNV